jgi:hypothetical protein
MMRRSTRGDREGLARNMYQPGSHRLDAEFSEFADPPIGAPSPSIEYSLSKAISFGRVALAAELADRIHEKGVLVHDRFPDR